MDILSQSEIIYLVLIMIATAIPAGFAAGLFGIGGGLITVPFLFFIFETLNIDKSYIMHLAVGTSFSIIIPTSLSSVLTHKKNNYVDIKIIKTYIIFVIVGVLAGTVFAALMQTKALVLFFSLVVYFLGTYLLLSSNKNINSKKKLVKARDERLKTALRANMAKRKAQAQGRKQNFSNNKDIKFKLED